MRNVIFFIFCFCTIVSLAQPITPQWTRSYGADTVVQGMYPIALIADSINSLYIAGIKDTTHQDYRAFVEKYDSAGNRLWINYYYTYTKQVYLKSLALDNQGNVVAGGGDYYNFTILKYDANGSLLWKYSDTMTVHHELHSVLIDSDGYIYGVGNYNNGFDVSEIIKLTPGGSLIWRKNFVWGRIIYSGLYNDQLQFAVDRGDLLRLDSAGNTIKNWNTTNTNLSVVKTDSVSNFFIAGGNILYRVDSSFHTVWNVSYSPPYQAYPISDIALSGNYVYTTGPAFPQSILFGKFTYAGINNFSVLDTTILPGLMPEGTIEADNNQNIFIVGSMGQFSKILLKLDSTGVLVDSVSMELAHPYQIIYSHLFFNKRFYLGASVANVPEHMCIFKCDDQLNNAQRFYETNYQEAVETGNQLKVLPNGNIVGGGLFQDSLGLNNVILNCFDPSGNKLWIVHFNANPILSFDDIQADQSNNVFIAGRSSNDTTFICKFSPNGILQWTFYYNMVTSHIISDSFGNLYVIGADTVSTLLKIDPTGSLLWSKHYGFHSTGYAINLSSGNIYLGIVENNSSHDILYNYKIDTLGNVIWSSHWSVISNSALCYKILTDQNGDIITLALNDAGVYFMKTNSSGAVVWENNYLSSNFHDGISYDFDLGSDNSIYFVALYQNLNRGYIRKLDSSGNLMWEDSVYHPGMIYSKLLTVNCVDGLIILGGEYKDSLSGTSGLFSVYDTLGNNIYVDSFPIVELTEANTIRIGHDNTGSYYVLLTDTMQNNNLHLRKYSNLLTGIKDVEAELAFEFYPNPATEKIAFRLNSNRSEKVLFVLTDINGSVIETRELTLKVGVNESEFKINFLSSGIYLLNVYSGNKKVGKYPFCKL